MARTHKTSPAYESDDPPPYSVAQNTVSDLNNTPSVTVTINNALSRNHATFLPITVADINDSESDNASETTEPGDLLNAHGVNIHHFLSKVFRVLVGMSISICVIIAIFLSPALYEMSPLICGWIFWPLWLTIWILISFLMTIFDHTMRKPPMDLLFWTILTITIGLLLGALSAYIQTVKIVIGVGIICILCLCFCFIFDSMAYTPGRFLFFVTCLHTLAFGFLCIGYYPWDSFYIIFAPAAFFAYVGLGIEFRIKGEKSLRISESYYATLSLCMFFMYPIKKIRWHQCHKFSRSASV